jgi:hypothetical protein
MEGVKHAPAPWRRGIGNDCHKVFDEQGRIVADFCGFDDGLLIAAAPELLAVAEELLYRFPDLAELLGGPHDSAAAGKLITAAREAVAKVKGSRAS